MNTTGPKSKFKSKPPPIPFEMTVGLTPKYVNLFEVKPPKIFPPVYLPHIPTEGEDFIIIEIKAF